MGLVYGVGVSEDGKYKRSETINGVSNKTPEYELWKNMLARCYSKAMNKNRPRYVGCEVSDNFKNFQWFAEWCNNQVGFGLKNYTLEKDILFKNNRIYSEDTCRFAPISINGLFARTNKRRGSLPIGVTFNKKTQKYKAQCGNVVSKDNTDKGYIGEYFEIKDAFLAYKTKKEELIKYEAEKFRGSIADDLYIALINYQVEITD